MSSRPRGRACTPPPPVSPPRQPEPYEVVVPGPVKRAIGEKLPEDVAWAIIEFINGPLAETRTALVASFAGT